VPRYCGAIVPYARRAEKVFVFGQGVTILIIGLVTVLMILMGRGEYVWIPGLLTFWLVWTNLSIDWSDIHNSDRIDLGIGWFVMLVGIVLTIASPWVEGLMTKVGQSRAQAQYPYQKPQQYQQYQQYQQQYPQQPGQQPPSDQQPPYQGPPGQS
jgi:thiol:disulfide interchange protein